jgi:uridine phosphorylase
MLKIQTNLTEFNIKVVDMEAATLKSSLYVNGYPIFRIAVDISF